MPKNNRKRVIIVLALLAVFLAIVLVFYLIGYLAKEPTVKERLNIDNVEQIKDSAEGPEDTFSLLTTNASILFESGDQKAAEQYYVEALEFAKSTEDTDMQNAGYRLLLTYYKLTGRNVEYDSLSAEIGEERFREVFAPDPRDIEVDVDEAI